MKSLKSYVLSFNISLLCLVLFFCNRLNAQNLDSLWSVYNNTTKSDSVRLIAIRSITQQYMRNNPDSAIIAAQLQISLAQKQGNKKELAEANSFLGISYYYTGNYPASIRSHTEALKIYEELGLKGGIASSHNNIGILYFEQKNHETALKEFYASLKGYKELKDTVQIASISGNIGSVYYTMNRYTEALITNKDALYLLRRSKADPYVIANAINNIGVAYQGLKNYSDALSAFKEALEIREKIKDDLGIEISWTNLASLYAVQKDYKQSEWYADKALVLATKLNDLEGIKEIQQILSEIYTQTNRPGKALESYKAYISAKDSLINEENSKQIMQTQMQYEFDKKEALLKVEQGKKEALAASERNRQRIIIFFVTGILILSTLFAVFSYRRYKLTMRQKLIIEEKEHETQKQNHIITEQKHVIEARHKEITDSINYAERIQRSFLATNDMLDANLKDYFIFFKPKDVVSGDFYWCSKTQNGKFILATADSTGHGVPGAIMSLLNITSLEKAIEQETSPDKVLNITRHIIIERLKNDGTSEGGKDGMDCSLCVFDFKNNSVLISAAQNPVWIVRGKEMIEIKPDKMPVGKHDNQNMPFTLHTVNLYKGDVVYTLTDGFSDQFGGSNAKKFMSKNLREFLQANAQLPMSEQKELLTSTFNNWKGKLEQVDDVTIIGIKV